MSTISVQMVAGESLNLSTKFFKASLGCLKHEGIDDITIGFHKKMSEEGREYVKQCDWINKIIELKGDGFSDWRNEVLCASPKTDYILKIDADETYHKTCLDALKQTADEGIRDVVFVSVDHLMITPDKKQNIGHIPVMFKSGPRWSKAVHECFRNPAESDSAMASGSFVHWGYVKPQISTFLKWAHYDLLEKGNLNGYRKENIETDNVIKQVDWFRDWRMPHTILDDRRDSLVDHFAYPLSSLIQILYEFNVSFPNSENHIDYAKNWEKWQKQLDPELFNWYDGMIERCGADWNKFLSLLEQQNFPEKW